MTKKDFIALADMIRCHNQHSTEPFTEQQICALAEFCRDQNQRFNRPRWIGYIKGECGPNGGVR
jgi:hypothetical protein